MSRDLIKYVNDIVSTYGSVEECAKDFNINVDNLKNLLSNPKVLTNDMNIIINTILRSNL